MKSNNPIVSQIIKDYSCSQKSFLPKELIIPLEQEYELKYEATVNSGDRVKEGSVIAFCKTEQGGIANIHASLPGTVLETGLFPAPNGKTVPAVKIKFGGSFTYLGKPKTEKNPSPDSNLIIRNLMENGVLNTFRTAFPENLGEQIKKNFSNKKEKKNLVVRMFDEDPYRITDYLMTKFFFDEIVKGARVIAKTINAKGIVFAIDQKFFDFSIFDKAEYQDINALEMNIRRYPCGTPREIVSAFERGTLKKTCDFTLSKKDLFVDSSTVYEVYKSEILSIPSIDKFVHFTGDCLNASCLLEVKLGTKLRDIVSQIGGFSKEPSLVVINGLLCGNSIHDLDTPITKYVKSVEFISKNRTTDEQMHSCINCGNCRFTCPAKLSPDILYNHTVNQKLLSESFTVSSLACIECGLCNTVCPARLPLCQIITLLKNNITGDK